MAHDGQDNVELLWQTQEQLCEALGISRTTLYRRVEAGTVERKKVGRKALFRVVGRVSLDVSNDVPDENGGTTTLYRGTRPTEDAEPEQSEQADQEQDLGSVLELLIRELAESQQRALCLTRELEQTKAKNHQLRDERDAALIVVGDLTGEMFMLECDSERQLTSLRKTVSEERRARQATEEALVRLRLDIEGVASSTLAWPVRTRLRALLKQLEA